MANHSPRFLQIVDDARRRVRETDIHTVRQWLEVRETFLLIDVREESEYARGHLPGAMHIGKGVIERDIEVKVTDPSTRLVLYCGGGYRSALAADAVQTMGYTSVFSMDGGWIEAGYPVEGGSGQ